MKDILTSINNRKSIRSFSDKEIPIQIVHDIIRAASRAPSAKNRQPWYFHAIRDEKKKYELINIMETGLNQLSDRYKKRGIIRSDIASAYESLQIMKQSQVIIFVLHVKKYKQPFNDGVDWIIHAKDVEVTDILSIGAAIQNMSLAACAYDIGTCWICDIYYAYQNICDFLKTDKSVLCALCMGYPNEEPPLRNRMNIESISFIE